MIKIVAVVLLAGSAVAHTEEPFEVAVVSFPEHIPLGVLLYVSVEARNVSGHPVKVAFSDLPLFLDVSDDTGRSVEQCPELKMLWRRTAKISKVSATWKQRKNLLMCVRIPGQYQARVVMRSSWVDPRPRAEGPQPWLGTAVSRTFTFRVIEPEGVDQKAYDAFGGNPLPILDREGIKEQLLSRFPTSTYAAYAIWKKYAKGLAGVETQRAVQTLAEPYPFRSELAPCDASGAPRGGSETRLDPTTFFRCRYAWMDLVLTNHPAIWFADEIRLRLSLDKYRLNDKDACVAGLEELTDHGRPDVATKAGELLAAMKAKGMLEEKEK